MSTCNSPSPAQIGLHSGPRNPKITSPKWRSSNITSTSLPTRRTSASRRLSWTPRMPRSSTSSSSFFSFRLSTSNSSTTTTTPSYPPLPSESNHIGSFYRGTDITRSELWYLIHVFTVFICTFLEFLLNSSKHPPIQAPPLPRLFPLVLQCPPIKMFLLDRASLEWEELSPALCPPTWMNSK